jgi:hypothetical protein
VAVVAPEATQGTTSDRRLAVAGRPRSVTDSKWMPGAAGGRDEHGERGEWAGAGVSNMAET